MDNAKQTLTMAEKHSVSYQKELLPIGAVHIHNNDQGSADLQSIVTGTNNKDYAVKLLSDGNGYVPATELFCYELAAILNIPTPSYDLITMRDGSLAFGSLWEGGVHKIEDINQVVDILSGKKPVRDLNLFLSRVYAFDLFINNLDRHFGNYLFRESYNSLIGLAFDYSRAWYEVGAYDHQSLEDQGGNTQVCHCIIKDFKKYERSVAIATLDAIGEIPQQKIIELLRTIPDEWLDTSAKEEVTNWWASDAMKNRIIKIKGGI